MTRTHLKTNSNLTQQKSNLLVSYTDLKMTYPIYGQAGVGKMRIFINFHY